MKNVNAANAITSLRIIGALALMFVAPFSKAFFIIYTASGVSDVLDGFVARITKKVSDFGARLDSVADLLFYAVMTVKIFPVLIERLPVGIWYAVTAVVIVRLVSYLLAAVKYHRFASLHTKLNKATGLAVFMIPYMLNLSFGPTYCMAACTVSAASSLEELAIHIRNKEYNGR